ncbi:uncharacterized protein [Ptychodera flava]|uniref:uncharacterized protein n=1 Tax=Ptychodera flava TaxID=63121 RepID=UPI003969C1B7
MTNTCSWRPDSTLCYPGTCPGAPSTCVCAEGFSGPDCLRIDTSPTIDQCTGTLTRSGVGYLPSTLDCSTGAPQYCPIKAESVVVDWVTSFVPDLSNIETPAYVNDTALGIVDAELQWTLQRGHKTIDSGSSTCVAFEDLNIDVFDVPLDEAQTRNCEHTITITAEINHNDLMEIIVGATNGGFIRLNNFDVEGAVTLESPKEYEVLAENIRKDDSISGYILPDKQEEKIKSFADDTTLYLRNLKSITQSLKMFNKYEKATGAKLNKKKSKGLWTGSFKNRTDSVEGIDFSNKVLQILGVGFGNSNTSRENWKTVMEKFTNCLKIWNTRNLSFKGRAIVANMLAASKLWYLASFDHVPKEIINEANSKLWKFIWRGKREVIKRGIFIQRYDDCGKKVVDIEEKINFHKNKPVKTLVIPSASTGAPTSRRLSIYPQGTFYLNILV